MPQNTFIHQAAIGAGIACFLWLGSWADAQEKNRAAPRQRAVSVQQTFEPTFSIEPLSHRIPGRGGDVLPFSFSIESNNRETEVEVIPIGLKQELTGLILHDESATQADWIRLATPSRVTIPSNGKHKIEGVVRIPQGEAKHHSIGILVRDLGALNRARNRNPTDNQTTQALVSFVTQYLLRLDLEVEGARGQSGTELALEGVTMKTKDGRPQLQAIVNNPSDTTFEFELRARYGYSRSDRQSKNLRLAMPVRASLESEERFVARILPKSRIRMEELLPEAIASGTVHVDLDLSVAGRSLIRESFPIDVNAEDYPAQEVLIAQVGDGVQVSPAQMELSMARGGKRRITVVIENRSQDTRTIQLKPMTSDGFPLGNVAVQPEEIKLSPGGSRKLAVTLRSQPGEASTQYGWMAVQVQSDKKEHLESRQLPLAILVQTAQPPDIELSPLVWDTQDKYPGFRTTVRNLDDSHLALEARLTILDAQGNRILVPAGFGRWLMPGQSSRLEFRLEQALLPGEYRLKCEVKHGQSNKLIEQTIQVTDLENAVPVGLQNPR
jgi:hypothetical protein